MQENGSKVLKNNDSETSQFSSFPSFTKTALIHTKQESSVSPLERETQTKKDDHDGKIDGKLFNNFLLKLIFLFNLI